MGYADCGLVALSGAAALIAALVGDKFGIAKVRPICPGAFFSRQRNKRINNA